MNLTKIWFGTEAKTRLAEAPAFLCCKTSYCKPFAITINGTCFGTTTAIASLNIPFLRILNARLRRHLWRWIFEWTTKERNAGIEL
jgi:hypothetical protein